MIDAELKARIRRLFYAEHWKVGTIAGELGVHHDVVERAVGTDRFASTGARPVRQSLLDEYKDFIRQTLDQHPRLRSTRLHEMLRGRGYAGSAGGVPPDAADNPPAPQIEAD